MHYAHILARVTGQPWLITAAAGEAIATLLTSRLAATPLPEPAPVAPPAAPRRLGPATPGTAVAVIPARGILGKNLGLMETMCGGLDVDRLLAEVETALAAPEVGTVVLLLDSPGGAATGIPEAHRALLRLREQSGKPLLAVVDGLCASAGMYLAAACTSIACTRTAQLGSIGCVMQLRFRSAADAAEGLEVRTYRYGRYKDLGNPHRLPTPEEDALLQARVDTLGRMFEQDLLAARPGLKPEVFDALLYFGEQAVALGLADELVESAADYVAALTAATA